ncbi:MAG: PepSY domain-containing protein [Gemmatimonadales bacterium]
MSKSIARCLALGALLLVPAMAVAQQGVPVIKEGRPGLKAKATLSADSAVAIAMRAAPSGSKIKEAELEEEKGVLIYSFDLSVPGKTGTQEVGVDARTGKIVENSYESDADEAAEAKAEAKKPTPRR